MTDPVVLISGFMADARIFMPQREQPEAVTRALEIFLSGRLPPLMLR